MEGKRPVIGISAYDLPVAFGQWSDVRSVLAPAGYTTSVERAGGMPVVLPPVDGSTELLDLLDGLVFTGGSDLGPALYGQKRHPETTGVHDARDRTELALIREALRRDMPVLGICRGMQLLNVALGGDLHQHLGSETHKGPPGRYTFHDVTVASGTRLAEVLGTRTRTHSCHHQAPDRLGDGLRASAHAEDGTVEAVESPSARFSVGVLWHPEEDDVGGAPLFRELVAQATTYRRAAA
ncbi:MAG TPA: gamma-glutamyl-gamma-aminobutyrate hydrolase family protein [Gaiellales bacterium]|jgi:gamma-glutamyl-gamma-aminobutyrate hydrolase PuuD